MITVIIPSIRATYLTKALDSLLSQTLAPSKIIVFDDGSQEDIFSIVSRYSASLIQYIRSDTNLGAADPTKTWNACLKYVDTEYVCLIGDDDYVSDNFIDEITKLIKAFPGAALFRARLCVIDKNDKPLYYGWSLPEIEKWDEYLYFRTKYGRPQSTCEFVAKVGALRSLGGYVSFPLAWGSDDATWLSLTAIGDVVSTNRAYGYWRQHKSSISNQAFDSRKREAFESLFLWETKFIEDHPSTQIEKELLIDVIQARFIPEITMGLTRESLVLKIMREMRYWMKNRKYEKYISNIRNKSVF